jgi:hypothetical protein
MHKFHSIAALCGDGLRPELRELFERLAIDPHSGLHIRHDGMVQAGPDPVSKASTRTEDRNIGVRAVHGLIESGGIPLGSRM